MHDSAIVPYELPDSAGAGAISIREAAAALGVPAHLCKLRAQVLINGHEQSAAHAVVQEQRHAREDERQRRRERQQEAEADRQSMHQPPSSRRR
jgi:hypothetical protein